MIRGAKDSCGNAALFDYGILANLLHSPLMIPQTSFIPTNAQTFGRIYSTAIRTVRGVEGLAPQSGGVRIIEDMMIAYESRCGHCWQRVWGSISANRLALGAQGAGAGVWPVA
jgi:hypothetical protein